MRIPREGTMEWEFGDKSDEVNFTAQNPVCSLCTYDRANAQIQSEEFQVIRPVIPSFFVISSPSMDWTKISNITKEIAERRKVWITRTPEQQAVIENPEWEVLHSFSEITSGSSPKIFNRTALGREMAQLFYNQSVHGDVFGRDISISSTGMRRFVVEVQQYNLTLKRYKKVMVFDTDDRQIQLVPGAEIVWKGGQIPADRPQCLNEKACILDSSLKEQIRTTWKEVPSFPSVCLDARRSVPRAQFGQETLLVRSALNIIWSIVDAPVTVH
ncbi:hypothetical protein RvY_06518 [Ramazzottius varieornatus]|uniref:Uncharacterized protein n=1 Tax=Ramazzottius varieornatus TaxID=947166 RepID=A0A1D1UYX0_RAMVA|nr:hypothetical protein RvY_06518 [Ramazzottius varieornatus]